MKTQLKEITPAWAAQILERRNPRNRRLSDGFVLKLARDIANDAFITTHQGIAFDENGDLLDGQHRLAAVVMANKSIRLPVTTGIESVHKLNGSTINTFEAIDGGKPRGVPQMLQLAGYTNTVKLAATVRVVVCQCSGKRIILSTPQTHKALMYIGKNAERICATASNGKIIRPPAYACGAAVIYHASFPEQAEAFIREVADVCGAQSSPSRALATWMSNHPQAGGAAGEEGFKVASSALYHAHHGNQVVKLYSNNTAIDWLLSLNKNLTAKMAGIASL